MEKYSQGTILSSIVEGTGFLAEKSLKHIILDFKAIDERMFIRLRVKCNFFNISIINAHAPTEDAENEDKEMFYSKLETVYDGTPGSDVKMVMGHFNAKMGKEDIFIPVVGQYSLHQTCNDNGLKAVDFTMSRNLKICSTYVPHKEIRKCTWISPDGKTSNQIDQVMIEGRHASDIEDVRNYGGADADHFLVRIKYKQGIQRGNRVNK
jgi:hypothetical protein